MLLDQILEQPLPLDLRLPAQISAAQPQKIEGEVEQAILIASAEIRLQLGEVRAALMDDDNLAVDDGLTFDIKGAGDPRELADPVVAVARVRAAIVSVIRSWTR